MADASFDIVSEIDLAELDNAINQAKRELATRFDFRGTGADVERSGDEAAVISAETEDRVTAALDVLKEKLIKRGISLKSLDAGDPRVSGKESKIDVTFKQGIGTEDAKKIGKIIRDEGPKGVKPQIQGEKLRVTGKKRDDLQAVIALLKGKDLDVALQFTNYR
ncbi:YajQ family cyclic di-GMP-binding protein [Glycomyces buryatensis]|uniref:Nucleotide-binding protein FAB82_16415 n=1 Tax=Glycomyces buryatensis TaxID=2570927 RepID=A0A4S8QBB5_9ACTN|nr:YajQ family cyclic di-GMP-binding protein [Glycomyces buryatensis]THV40105.1 YajQ family cyclic di-GMP-binding protein [Glycomyces buryatensis]